jgi:hypothetical protein
MVDDRELHGLRREARALQRAVASRDRVAEERASRVLGGRVERRFALADALHVVAREHGATSWPALVARARRGRVGAALDEGLDEEGRSEVDVETSVDWPGGEPVVIAVSRRKHRYLLDDRGEAVHRAGRPAGWVAAAEAAAGREGMNVSPTNGVIFVPAVGRVDLDDLAHGLARSSLDVLEALVELDEQAGRHR